MAHADNGEATARSTNVCSWPSSRCSSVSSPRRRAPALGGFVGDHRDHPRTLTSDDGYDCLMLSTTVYGQPHMIRVSYEMETSPIPMRASPNLVVRCWHTLPVTPQECIDLLVTEQSTAHWKSLGLTKHDLTHDECGCGPTCSTVGLQSE